MQQKKILKTTKRKLSPLNAATASLWLLPVGLCEIGKRYTSSSVVLLDNDSLDHPYRLWRNNACLLHTTTRTTPPTSIICRRRVTPSLSVGFFCPAEPCLGLYQFRTLRARFDAAPILFITPITPVWFKETPERWRREKVKFDGYNSLIQIYVQHVCVCVCA